MTQSESIYRGVNLGTPVHPFLKPGWVKPVSPAGYPHCVAILAPTRRAGESAFTNQWSIDFMNTEQGTFASHEAEEEVEYPWPWREGFKPMPADWDAIGIPHLY